MRERNSAQVVRASGIVGLGRRLSWKPAPRPKSRGDGIFSDVPSEVLAKKDHGGENGR